MVLVAFGLWLANRGFDYYHCQIQWVGAMEMAMRMRTPLRE